MNIKLRQGGRGYEKLEEILVRLLPDILSSEIKAG